METLDGALNFSMASVFPPTPPSSASSPGGGLTDTTTTTLYTTPSWDAPGSWTLDGLPDVKPDANTLLQTSLDLPVLNADSTNFFLNGESGGSSAVDSLSLTAPWIPQWAYCSYCAAGGGASACSTNYQTVPQGLNQSLSLPQGLSQGLPQGLCQNAPLSVPQGLPQDGHHDILQQGPQGPNQLYSQQSLFLDPYFTVPFSDDMNQGLMYMDGLSPAFLPGSEELDVPSPSPSSHGPPELVLDAPAPAPVAASAPAPAPAAGPAPATARPSPDSQGKPSKRSRLSSSRDPVVSSKPSPLQIES